MTQPVYLYAGYWGPEAILLSTNSDPARQTPMKVIDRITGELATLYADELKSETVANPTKTDVFGNLQFFATPGFYDVSIVGSSYSFVAMVRPALSEDSGGGGVGVVQYEHTQPVAQSVWTVNHNLGIKPSAVSVFSLDYGQQYDEFSVQHLNSNSLLVSMDVPIAGRALM